MEKHKRVLVVDDESVVRRVAAVALGGEFDVFVLSSGMYFDETIEDIHPDLIILDVKMPILSGFQLCSRLRSHPRGRQVPVVFLSALSSEEDQAAGRQSGGDYYLAKPVDIQELRRVVKELIHRPVSL